MTTAFALLQPLKTNLGIVAEVYDEQLLLLLRNAQDAITREGVTLTGSAEDDTLTIQYAAWTWRERNTGGAMPRMLRFALNNRILSAKARGT